MRSSLRYVPQPLSENRFNYGGHVGNANIQKLYPLLNGARDACPPLKDANAAAVRRRAGSKASMIESYTGDLASSYILMKRCAQVASF
jgi:hypothetical protein